MKQTSNYKFNLPEDSDTIDINKINDNFTKIDSKLKECENALTPVTFPKLLDVIYASGSQTFYHGTMSGFFDTMSMLSEVNTTFGKAVFGKHYGTFNPSRGSSISLSIMLYVEQGQIKWDEYYNTSKEGAIMIGTAIAQDSGGDTKFVFSYVNDYPCDDKTYTVRDAIVELAMLIRLMKGMIDNG
mgnify:CR=1 FL=1